VWGIRNAKDRNMEMIDVRLITKRILLNKFILLLVDMGNKLSIKYKWKRRLQMREVVVKWHSNLEMKLEKIYII